MKLYYLGSSAFVALFEKTAVIFDCCNKFSKKKTFSDGRVDAARLSAMDAVYFLVSHKHADHFHSSIYDYAEYNENTKYIIDDGVAGDRKVKNIFRLSPGEAFADDRIVVRAFGSTDLGVSFDVEIEGTHLFHAGDLNCWHWTQENDEKHEQAAREAFTHELDIIRKEVKEPIALAMFPVDSRMKGSYADGADEFIAVMQPKNLVPMHFWGDFAAAAEYETKQPCAVAPKRVGDRLEFDL